MAMSERQRRAYNRECATIAELEKDVRLTSGVVKKNATERLKEAWIAFDEKWNERTPTDAQMTRWLETM